MNELRPIFCTLQSTDHEGTSKELAADIPTPTLEMQELPTPLTKLESTKPSNVSLLVIRLFST